MKSMLIGIAVVLTLFAVGFFMLSASNYDGEQEVSFKWTSAPIFSDEETGFTLTLPQSWQDISYQIEKRRESNGTIVFALSLPYKDEQGNLKAGFASSEIQAVPIASYAPKSDDIGFIDEQLGTNSKYVFVSRQYSPEAFGICVSDYRFYEMNTMLCDGGASLRNPERTPGVFTITKNY